MNFDTIIMGGGPAGMTAAIIARRNGRKVCIVEHQDRIGKKILSTGNGKCNITNMDIGPHCYNSNSKEDFFSVIEKFDPRDIIAFFNGMGMLTMDKNGYIYPRSEQASVVLDTLRFELEKLGVVIFTNAKDAKITSTNNGFKIKFGDTEITSNKLILACGSKCAPKTGSDGSGYVLASNFGHKIIKVIPALVQIICAENFYKELQGVRCNANLKINVNNETLVTEQGELQLTGYGISGIPVFQLSRTIKRLIDRKQSPVVYIDFVPEYTENMLIDFITNSVKSYGNNEITQILSGIINKKIANVIVKECNIKPSSKCEDIDSNQIKRIVTKIKNFSTIPKDTNGFDNAQVCAGGVELSDIDLNTMESKLVKGLYFAGEILDVDGRCGGYNLTWAFASGKLAGDNQ